LISAGVSAGLQESISPAMPDTAAVADDVPPGLGRGPNVTKSLSAATSTHRPWFDSVVKFPTRTALGFEKARTFAVGSFVPLLPAQMKTR
jgi:hypothetical protein